MSIVAYQPTRSVSTSILFVAGAGSIANALVALCAVLLGVASDSTPFAPIAYISLTVVAAVAGAFGWNLINTRTRRPRQILAWLVPTVFVLSVVPDILLGVMAAWSVPLVLAAMTMHVVTTAIAVGVFSWRMPVVRG